MVPEMTQEQIDAINRQGQEYARFPAPITDAEMAELDRLRAAATPGEWDRFMKYALAASPDEHVRRIKAAALRGTAKELENLRDHIQDYIAPDDARDDIRRICLNRARDLRDEADRLEANHG